MAAAQMRSLQRQLEGQVSGAPLRLFVPAYRVGCALQNRTKLHLQIP